MLLVLCVCMCMCTRMLYVSYVIFVVQNNDCRLLIAVPLIRCPLSLTRLCDAAVFTLALSISSHFFVPQFFHPIFYSVFVQFSILMIKCSTHLLRLMMLTFVHSFHSQFSSLSHLLALQPFAVLFPVALTHSPVSTCSGCLPFLVYWFLPVAPGATARKRTMLRCLQEAMREE